LSEPETILDRLAQCGKNWW